MHCKEDTTLKEQSRQWIQKVKGYPSTEDAVYLLPSYHHHGKEALRLGWGA